MSFKRDLDNNPHLWLCRSSPLRKTQINLFFHSLICTFAAKMRRALLTMGILSAICAVCLTVLLNWQNHSDATAAERFQHRESSVVTPQHQQHCEATLTDASQLYRVCSSRPQRILSSQGSKTERTILSVALKTSPNKATLLPPTSTRPFWWSRSTTPRPPRPSSTVS